MGRLRWQVTTNHADRILCLGKLLAYSPFGSLEPFTVCKIGDFPYFLSALTSNKQFIIKLVKMWPGGTFMWWSEL